MNAMQNYIDPDSHENILLINFNKKSKLGACQMF